MHRFFLTSEDDMTTHRIIIKDDETVKHLVKVLRAKINEPIELVDTQHVYVGTIEELTKNHVTVSIQSKKTPENESSVNIDLFQCLPKGQKLELILQKNVELGAHAFYLVQSKRCIVDFKEQDVPKKLLRYERIVRDAAKQSKRDLITPVYGVLSIQDLLDKIPLYDLFIVLYENQDDLSMKKALEHFDGKKMAILVGPEGGFEGSEIQALHDNGAKIVTLGKRILRTETAGFVAMTLAQYELGAFE